MSVGFFGLQLAGLGDIVFHRETLWKQLAYVTRYGHQSLDNALDLVGEDRIAYMTALNILITEENKSGSLVGG